MEELDWDNLLQSSLDLDFEGSVSVLKDQLVRLLDNLSKNGLSVEVITPSDKVNELIEQISLAESEPIESPLYVNPRIIWEEYEELIESITEMKQRNSMQVLVKMYSFDARLIREAAVAINCFLQEYYPKCKMDINILEFNIDNQGGQYKKYLTINFCF